MNNYTEGTPRLLLVNQISIKTLVHHIQSGGYLTSPFMELFKDYLNNVNPVMFPLAVPLGIIEILVLKYRLKNVRQKYPERFL